MKKKVFRAVFLSCLLVLFICLFLNLFILYSYSQQVEHAHLSTLAQSISAGVSQGGTEWLNAFNDKETRVTLIEKDGTVLFDTIASPTTMENHLNRPEVQQALETGIGQSDRTSQTLMERTYYYAIRLANGSILRLSSDHSSFFSLLISTLLPTLSILAFLLVFANFMAHRLATRIASPLNSINLEQPMENDVYEELSPLLKRLEQQKKQMAEQMHQLQSRQDEFNSITGSLSEGLVLLNENSEILSINDAAAHLFDTNPGCVGQNLLTINRTTDIQNLVNDAQNGKHGESQMTIAGRIWQVDANPVIVNGKCAGVCLLTFDITEKAQAEQIRREFSANVSHELKSPLQTIMGSAELMESGLVRSEDIPGFISRIRAESARLVTLIDDIMRLSQLDEGGVLPLEDVQLMHLAEEVAEALSPRAKEKGVTLSVTGTESTLNGVRRLLYEIVYNLSDNAIKYNKANGWVEIHIAGDSENVTLTVKDSGIGIPKEHQMRIFERFYRVDKSHSRATGGTGLGLSIVKHAVLYHKAKIELHSEPNIGTTIKIVFPRNAFPQ